MYAMMLVGNSRTWTTENIFRPEIVQDIKSCILHILPIIFPKVFFWRQNSNFFALFWPIFRQFSKAPNFWTDNPTEV